MVNSYSYMIVMGQLYKSVLNDGYKVLVKEIGNNGWMILRIYIETKRFFGLLTKKVYGRTFVIFKNPRGERDIIIFKIWEE